jgi:hypothetical protein
MSTYSLNNYSISKALFWGNCFEHFLKAIENSPKPKSHRLVHFIAAITEALPLVSQIISLSEMMIVTCCRPDIKELKSKKIKIVATDGGPGITPIINKTNLAASTALPLPLPTNNLTADVIKNSLKELFKQDLAFKLSSGKELEIPFVDWSKINFEDPKSKKISLCELQTELKQIVTDILQDLKLMLNKKGFYKGIDVSKKEEIEIVKKEILKKVKASEGNITSLFEMLSRAGMAGYADQIRTSLASLGMKASDIDNSVRFDAYPDKKNATKEETHEDQWTLAIRQGHKHYKLHYVKAKNKALLTSEVLAYNLDDFDDWDHKKLCQNPELQQLVFEKVQSNIQKLQKLENEDPEHQSLQRHHYFLFLKQLAFLNPLEGLKFYNNFFSKRINGDTQGIPPLEFTTSFIKRLELLELKGAYDKNEKEAMQLFNNFNLLLKSFGKNKVHPQSIEVAIANSEKTIEITLKELQQAKVIGTVQDKNGFYPLDSGAKDYDAKGQFQSCAGRIEVVLEIAKGNISDRYAARRLAPTFYQGSTSNENFDIPRQKLPLLIQYHDSRCKLLEKTKNRLMEKIGVRWNGPNANFQIVDQNKFAFIKDNTTVADLPVGPSVVSVFFDSIASLGGGEWALNLCNFLETTVGANVFWKPAIENQNKIFEAALKEQNQLQGPSGAKAFTAMPITSIQEEEYQNRRNRILKLHKEGTLHVRVIGRDGKEIHSKTGIYKGKWLLHQGPNLSTTLLPRAGSPIEMRLFDEGSRAVLIDPFTVTPDYFGNGFLHNGCTQHNNFAKQLQLRKDGFPLARIQAELAKESAKVEVGQAKASRDHTEIAYFRPAERNLVTGLFFKVNDEDFADNLRALIQLQNTIRQSDGMFLPLFAYKGRHFQEIIVDSAILQILGLGRSGIPVRQLTEKEKTRKAHNPADFFNLYGELDTQMILAAKEQMSLLPQTIAGHEKHKVNFKKLFDLQLMLLQIKGPQEKISFTMSTSFKVEEFIDNHLKDYAGNKKDLLDSFKEKDSIEEDEIVKIIIQNQAKSDKAYSQKEITDKLDAYKKFIAQERPVDLSIIDNLHLVFPTVFQTGNKSAEAQDLYFSHSLFVRFLRTTPDYCQFWLQMTKRNMKVFLGIDLKVNPKEEVISVSCDKNFLAYFKDNEDPTGKIPYARCISRLMQMLYLLDKQNWANDIVISLRKTLGANFGIDENSAIDFFSSSQEIKQIQNYLTLLANPNFERISKLPESSHGTNVLASNTHFAGRGGSRFASPPIVLEPARGLHRSRLPNQNPVTSPSKVDSSANQQKLTNLYRDFWVNSDSDYHQTRDKLVEEIGLVEKGTYCKEVVFDLVGAEFDSLFSEGAYEVINLKNDLDSVQLYYTDKIPANEVLKLLTQTAVRTTNGDLDVLLANGKRKISTNDASKLLNDQQRRLKRNAMVLAGRVTVTAKGGYKSQREKLDKKISVIFINTAAPQFEKYGMGKNELEVADFIVKVNAAANTTPLFKEYYQKGIIPSHQDLENKWKIVENKLALFKAQGKKAPLDALRNSKGLLILSEDHPLSVKADIVKLNNGDFYLGSSFKTSIRLYLEKLVLPAIQGIIGKDAKPMYLKATAFGAGFFAALGLNENFVTSLKKYVLNSLLETYEHLIIQRKFAEGTIIEFPFYDVESLPESLKTAAFNAKVKLIFKEKRDLLDFSMTTSVDNTLVDPELFNRVVLNAGDAFSFVGNEGESASLEAMLANNSNARMVFNWHFNPYILDSKRHHQLV